MISHLNQYIIDKMIHRYKVVCIFLLCMVKYIFFGIKVISRLIGLTYENIAKMANKIFNVPNHLKISDDLDLDQITPITILVWVLSYSIFIYSNK